MKCKVLIIEKNQIYSVALVRLLKSGGYHIIGVTQNITEALLSISQYLPDIIIANLQLEGGSSSQLIHHIKSVIHYNPYIIVASSYINEHTKDPNHYLDTIVHHLNSYKNNRSSPHSSPSSNPALHPHKKQCSAPLLKLISQTLDSYAIKHNTQTRKYLLRVLFHILSQDHEQNIKISPFYDIVAKEFAVESKTVSMGIERLLKKSNVIDRHSAKSMTNKSFINQVISECRQAIK